MESIATEACTWPQAPTPFTTVCIIQVRTTTDDSLMDFYSIHIEKALFYIYTYDHLLVEI